MGQMQSHWASHLGRTLHITDFSLVVELLLNSRSDREKSTAVE